MFDDALRPTPNIGSMRVAGGLGTVPRIVAENMENYARRMPVSDALSRIEALYKPYHACLRAADSPYPCTVWLFGPDRLPLHAGQYSRCGIDARPDYHHWRSLWHSASADLSRAALHILEDLGFNAVRNKPYAGGFITEHYGRPVRDCMRCRSRSTVRSMSMSRHLRSAPDFEVVAAAISLFMRQMIEFAEEFSVESALAAE